MKFLELNEREGTHESGIKIFKPGAFSVNSDRCLYSVRRGRVPRRVTGSFNQFLAKSNFVGRSAASEEIEGEEKSERRPMVSILGGGGWIGRSTSSTNVLRFFS